MKSNTGDHQPQPRSEIPMEVEGERLSHCSVPCVGGKDIGGEGVREEPCGSHRISMMDQQAGPQRQGLQQLSERGNLHGGSRSDCGECSSCRQVGHRRKDCPMREILAAR